MSNVFDLGGNKKPDLKASIQNALYEMQANTPLILEIARQKSAYQKERMTALKREGFTHEEALEIIKVERTPYDPTA